MKIMTILYFNYIKIITFTVTVQSSWI